LAYAPILTGWVGFSIFLCILLGECTSAIVFYNIDNFLSRFSQFWRCLWWILVQ